MRAIYLTLLCLVQVVLMMVEFLVVEMPAPLAIGFGCVAFVLLLIALVVGFRADDGSGKLYGSGVEVLVFVMSSQALCYTSGLVMYAALGATTVQAVRVSGHTKVEDFLSGGSPAEEEEPVVLSQTFSPTQPPHLPGNLVWLEHEPQWKLGAEKRIHGTGPLPSLELQWTEDFSINTGLTSRLRRAGWKFDAQQIHFSPTIWRFKAE
jgi:hypothetical protein